jgi:hypothetical protein
MTPGVDNKVAVTPQQAADWEKPLLGSLAGMAPEWRQTGMGQTGMGQTGMGQTGMGQRSVGSNWGGPRCPLRRRNSRQLHHSRCSTSWGSPCTTPGGHSQSPRLPPKPAVGGKRARQFPPVGVIDERLRTGSGRRPWWRYCRGRESRHSGRRSSRTRTCRCRCPTSARTASRAQRRPRSSCRSMTSWWSSPW